MSCTRSGTRSPDELRAEPPEPAAALVVVGQPGLHLVPEGAVVVPVLRMRQLVDEHVLDERDGAWMIRQLIRRVPCSVAAPPAPLLLADDDRRLLDPEAPADLGEPVG
jgi:hypothetical protein